MGGSNPNIATPQQVAQPSVALNTAGGGNSPLGFYEAQPWNVPNFTPKEAKESNAGATSGADQGQMAGKLLKMYLASRNGGDPSNFSSQQSYDESFTKTGKYDPAGM